MATRSFIGSFITHSIKEGNTFQFNKVGYSINAYSEIWERKGQELWKVRGKKSCYNYTETNGVYQSEVLRTDLSLMVSFS